MAGIVQHKSAETTAQNVSVTLDSPVTEGNLIVAFVGWFGGNGANFEGFVEDSNPSPSFQNVGEVIHNPDGLECYYDFAPSSGTYTLTAQFTANDGTGRHLHVFEISGYNKLDQSGSNNQFSNTPSVTTASNTSFANEVVLAAFLDITHIDESFTAGAGFTRAETTNTNSLSMFSEYQTTSSVGQPSASASIGNTDVVISMIVTFYNSNSPTPPAPGSIFLGSVRVLGSAPSGARVPYLGTVKVVASPPTGATNPYLGSVVIGTLGPGNTNPSLGDVVVVDTVPAGDSDPFLGSVAEG